MWLQVLKKGALGAGRISCWRSIFAANEFCELAALRRSCPVASFLILVRPAALSLQAASCSNTQRKELSAELYTRTRHRSISQVRGRLCASRYAHLRPAHLQQCTGNSRSMSHDVAQVTLMKGLGWDGAAYTHPAGHGAACAGLVPRSDVLAYGAAAGLYLLIVAAQVAGGWALMHARVPCLGNLEHPCDAFWCASLPSHASLCSRRDNAIDRG